MPWRSIEGGEDAPRSTPELETLLKGVFEKRRCFLAFLKDFIVLGDTGQGLAKILAGYHQFHAVRHAVDRTLEATSPGGDRKVGVIWHTQGSGKSLLMAFYAGEIVKHPAMENPTLVVITDRNDLDDQLFGTFSMCRSCCGRRRSRRKTATTCAACSTGRQAGDLHHHPEIHAGAGEDRLSAADRPPQCRRDCG